MGNYQSFALVLTIALGVALGIVLGGTVLVGIYPGLLVPQANQSAVNSPPVQPVQTVSAPEKTKARPPAEKPAPLIVLTGQKAQADLEKQAASQAPLSAQQRFDAAIKKLADEKKVAEDKAHSEQPLKEDQQNQAFESQLEKTEQTGAVTEQAPTADLLKQAAEQAQLLMQQNPNADPKERADENKAADDKVLSEQQLEENQLNQELDAQIQEAEQAELAEKKRKYEKFKAFYKKSEQCDPPLTSQMRVQCANEYMRAREKFDELYQAGKL